MLGPHFYNEAIRKTVIGFGTLFNNIEILFNTIKILNTAQARWC